MILEFTITFIFEYQYSVGVACLCMKRTVIIVAKPCMQISSVLVERPLLATGNAPGGLGGGSNRLGKYDRRYPHTHV